MCPCTPDHCRMSCRGSWSPRPSWPPSMSPCPWWRGGRTSWRSARTSWSQPSRPPAASGCLPRSSEKVSLVAWSSVDWVIGWLKNLIGWLVKWNFPGGQLHLCPPAVQGDLYCHLQVNCSTNFFLQIFLLNLLSLLWVNPPKKPFKNHNKPSVCSGWTSSASSREGKLRRRSSRLPCYVFCICLLTYYT